MATPVDREKKKKSSGIDTVKMPGKVTMEVTDPDVIFFQMCELGDEKAIQEALKNKEQRIRIEDEKGEMPIHKLARQGCLDSVREVLDNLQKTDSVKTDVNWQDKQGKTPLFYAVEYGHLKLVQLFLDRGADVMVENNNGWTVLHTAVQTDSLECVQLILNHPRVTSQRQQLIAAKDKSERAALHIAAFKSKEGEMVHYLLKNGADPHAKDASGNTGVKLAEKTGRRKSRELLEESMQAAVKIATAEIRVVKAFGGMGDAN
jgi:ankyrin repeat protein